MSNTISWTMPADLDAEESDLTVTYDVESEPPSRGGPYEPPDGGYFAVIIKSVRRQPSGRDITVELPAAIIERLEKELAEYLTNPHGPGYPPDDGW